VERELTSHQPTTLANDGFGLEAQAALARRKQSLVDRSHVTDLGDGRPRAPKDLFQRLERTEVERAGQALGYRDGRQWKPTVPGEYVSGQLIGSTQLAGGRFSNSTSVATFPASPCPAAGSTGRSPANSSWGSEQRCR
jgi:hypothetical protein